MQVEAGRPGCIAANRDSVYYIAKTYIGDVKAFLLAKSSGFTSSPTNTWSVVSVTPSPNLATTRVWDFISNSDCSVDSNGVFTWRSYMDQFSNGVRYDPNTPWISTSGTTNPFNKTHGEWNKVLLTQPESVQGQIQLISEPGSNGAGDAKDTLVVYYPHASERDPAFVAPSINYATVKSEKEKIVVSEVNLAQSQLALTNSTIYNLAFGNGKMFSIMRGPPVQAPDGSIKYIKNLFHFPFTPNVVLSSPPLSRETVPWDPMCKDHPLDDQSTAAVANGRFYYLCEAPEIPSQPTYSNLYIFDSITSISRGPFRLVGTFDIRHFTLAYDSPQSPDPQYIILNSNRTVQAIDLATANGAFVTMTNLTDTMKPPALTVDPLPVASGATECESSCKKNTGVIVAATVVPIIIFAAAAVFLLWRRRKSARAQAQASHELSQLPAAGSVTDLPPYVEDQQA
ncbi:hypothetical protein BGZ74_008137 [Mortierella antarctica]|nr:hypothetical protein BGZ74_008137 [Mortierella antarctica]